mgnify:FL=1
MKILIICLCIIFSASFISADFKMALKLNKDTDSNEIISFIFLYVVVFGTVTILQEFFEDLKKQQEKE